MEFSSILNTGVSKYEGASGSSFYLDLNIDQIIKRISIAWGEDISRYFSYFPANRDVEDYRREVYGDIKREGLFEALLNYVKTMQIRLETQQRKEDVSEENQKIVWHIREVGYYCRALTEVYEALQKAALSSRGFLALREKLKQDLANENFVKMQEQVNRLEGELSGFRLLLTYDKERFVVSEVMGTEEGVYENFLTECFGPERKPLHNPFFADPELSYLETETIKIFRKKHPDFFQGAAAFYKQYQNYLQDVYLLLQKELAYYLGFMTFEKQMEGYGYVFCTPQTSDDGRMEAAGLYDLALACANHIEGKEVVDNDFAYFEGEHFFVLTGPNQGGKTTFARSLGQLVYFYKMGLDVPALSAKVPYFTELLTHFSVEESVETGRGKLKEELSRLSPMMNKELSGAFVVINELFTTAANYDACIMGKRVLEHFIGKQCMGIYVTHLKELAEEGNGIVSMRAMLNEKHIQTFHIARCEAEDLAYATNQVNKYRLTYEQLKERLS